MNRTCKHPLGSQWIVAALFAAAGLGLIYGFVRLAEPPERVPRTAFERNYSEDKLLSHLTATGLQATVTRIAEAGSQPGERQVGRHTGSRGFYRTETLIRKAFESAGLDVYSQEFQVVVPETEYCEILGEDGKALPGVTLYPVEPSGLVPPAVPPEGIKARLVQTESADLALLAGHDPRETIVLTYVDSAEAWRSLAGVGVRAIIVREDELAARMRADPDSSAPWATLNDVADHPFPRFVARGPIGKYGGQMVTIRAKVVWTRKPARNIVGVLRGKGQSREALVLSAFYDSSSVVPELAPGAEQSLSLAALLRYAEALGSYRGELNRDVVFVATAGHAQAMAGASRLMQAVERFTERQRNYQPPEQPLAEHQRLLAYAERALAICDDLAKGTESRQGLQSRVTQDAAFYEWFKAGMSVVAGEINLDRREEGLAAKLAYLRHGHPVFRDGFDAQKATDAERANPENTHPLLRAYLGAQMQDTVSGNMMTLPVWALAERTEFDTWGYAARATQYFRDLREYHRQQAGEVRDTIALRKVFAAYDRTLTVNLDLYSGGANDRNQLGVVTGVWEPGSVVEPQVTDLANALIANVPAPEGMPLFGVAQWGSRDCAGSKQSPCRIAVVESEMWFRCGRLAFTIGNNAFYPPKGSTPEDTFEGLSLRVMELDVTVIGRTLLAIASGQVPFKAIQEDRGSNVLRHQGTLFGSAGTATMIPSHPMWPRTFVRWCMMDAPWNAAIHGRGVNRSILMQTDPYGGFESGFILRPPGRTSNIMALRFDEAGRITYANTMTYGYRAASGKHTVFMFRCTPVAFYDQINPQTMKQFKGLAYVDQRSLSTPAKAHFGKHLAFLEPDATFYVGLLDGAAENKELLADRGFLLNVDREEPIRPDEPEVYGRGYLAADTPAITAPMFDGAASMLRTAEKRLRLQERFGMTDELMLGFHKQANEWLDVAKRKWNEKNPAAAVNAAGASAAYAINNHPVIRSRVSQAVVGILWYLGLLVPFVFFAEKLLFGFTDIRKQLAATGAIFLVVFSLLRVFHPAFEMVRSSLMILLGFVTLLLSLLVTVMVGGKFKQNLKDLRSKEGQVEGADISRGGVLGTAFMLGLNNMRRRKVRTGLTCGTLVLITFVVICFTSVSTDLVNVEQTTGRSTWNGLMIRDPNFRSLDGNEMANIWRIYGTEYPVTTHRWLTTELKVAGRGQNAEILIDHDFLVGGDKVARRSRVSAAVEMSWDEPRFTGIDRYLLTRKGWFTQPPGNRKEQLTALESGYKAKREIILPDTVARELGIRVEDVNGTDPVIVSVRNAEYEVRGIFDSVELGKCLGLDGQSLLPFDVNTIRSVGTASDGTPILPADAGRLPASQVILVNRLPEYMSGERQITANCLVLFPKESYRITPDGPEYPALDYRSQRRLVLGYLERIGQPAYYAIDGIAYYGSRQRARTVAGLLELLVPILIAAMTVFSTMRGSVYERRSEIYVYNAVGIAPNHVFFMFMAEACVYAVVGAVMGYILSQGMGRLLTLLDLTGGMKMDYSSIETIHASLAIMGAVFLSTIVPARDAAKLAAPSDTASWTVPPAEDGRRVFHLPFTFTAHDRVAVVSYFHRWLDANGLGSSGPFFCAPPEAVLETRGKLQAHGEELVPAVASTVWLKPYDLGVSQRMEIALPTDPETGEYVARITLTQLSGNVAGWERTLIPFMRVLRKQFLNWRATTGAERSEMFAESSRILEQCVEKEERHV